MKTVSVMASVVLICFSAILSVAQNGQQLDMKAVATAGHLNGSSEYENAYFGVTVRIPEPNSHLVLNGLVAENRAILLEAVNDRGGITQRHNFVVVAYSAYFSGHAVSTEQFVRGVCQQLESEEFRAIRSEIPVMIGGQRFIESDLKKESKDQTYYKAVMFTRMKGYMFGFWMEAATREQFEKATNLEGKVHFR
jgi:hypothetical protein